MARIKNEANPAEGTGALKETQVEPVAVTEDTPAWVGKLLKNFPGLDMAYVSKFGGVFGKGSPAALVKNATLYKNPYYKQ